MGKVKYNTLPGKLNKTVTKNQVYSALKEYIASSVIMDKVRIVLFVTWLWAWVGLYMAKLFEQVFRIILSIPNEWLPKIDSDIKTTDGKQIRILNAFDKNGLITNKLKLYLKYYWKQATEDSANEHNGFDFKKFASIIQSPILFCSYMLDEHIRDTNKHHEDTLSAVKRVFVERSGRRSRATQLPDTESSELFLNHMTFDEKNNMDIDSLDIDSLDEILLNNTKLLDR